MLAEVHATGKSSALTGEPWTPNMARSQASETAETSLSRNG